MHIDCADYTGWRNVFMPVNSFGTLYIVATPIGNTGDITERAKEILAGVDFIAAEDTRAAGLLLKSLNITNKLISNQKFNEKYREDYILNELEQGKNVAVVSDAGTPCISDPGGVIVRVAAARGIRVTAVCGASAVTAALSICGFIYDAYTFYGYLPRTENGIIKLLEGEGYRYGGIVKSRRTDKHALVFFESPKRIIKTIKIFNSVIPGASICLCNDLTKKYEKIYRGGPGNILDELSANPSAEKGEYTLVCMPGGAAGDKNIENGGGADGLKMANGNGADCDLESCAAAGDKPGFKLSPEAAIVDYLIKNGGTPKDAAAYLSNSVNITGYSKKELYAALNNLKKLIY